jgi:hypothetical protein
MDEADAIKELREAKVELDRSGDRRHIARALADARAAGMTDEAIAAELGVSREWLAEQP